MLTRTLNLGKVTDFTNSQRKLIGTFLYLIQFRVILFSNFLLLVCLCHPFKMLLLRPN